MTREEKVLKIKNKIDEYMNSLSQETYEALAEKIADVITEPEPPKFRSNEIIRCKMCDDVQYRKYSRQLPSGYYLQKLTAEELAHTAAPPDAVSWVMDNHIIFYKDKKGMICEEMWGNCYRTYCPHDGEDEGEL
jgi:hypothetical protein